MEMMKRLQILQGFTELNCAEMYGISLRNPSQM